MNMPICTSHAPWKAEFGLCGWGVLSARDEVVAYIPQSIVHDEANARLIASAPDLLVALETSIEMLSECMRTSRSNDEADAIDAVLSFANAAIAKAKGEQ